MINLKYLLKSFKNIICYADELLQILSTEVSSGPSIIVTFFINLFRIEIQKIKEISSFWITSDFDYVWKIFAKAIE